MFQLLTRGVSEGLNDLSHIAVLIHGFDSRPAVWADELARVRSGAMSIISNYYSITCQSMI